MDFELRRARQKLEKEQKERKQLAKLKLDREKKAKDEAVRLRQAVEAAQRIRRVEAAQAQSKADEQMAESLLSGGGIMFSRILEAVPYPGVGDKIKLPPSCFTELSDQGAFDKGPVYFRLSIPGHESSSDTDNKIKSHGVTHSGVLEFTADEGFVALPPQVWNNLLSSETLDTPLIEVQYVRLPKGTYAKLQSDEVDFLDVPNHKAVLETTLRQHATLSQDDVIIVRHGELTFKLHVLELKPSSSVSVLETDIEVDIVNPFSSDISKQIVLKPLTFGTSENGTVEEGQYMYYKFSLENDAWNIISSHDAKLEVKLDVETGSGDSDLYMSKHPLIYPTNHQHQWSSHDVGSKSLILSSHDQNLGLGTYSIGICGFKGVTKYTILVTIQENTNRGQQAGLSTSTLDVDSVECGNCKHYIPSRSIGLHEAYCRRHNVICKHAGCGVVLRVEDAKNHVHCHQCGKAFQQAEMEKHMKVFHEPIHCSCGVVLEKEEMVQHQSTVCPMRMITCRFCGDIVQAGNSPMDMRDHLRGLSEHESLCGSRTAPCDSCGRSVMLKEMDIHRVAVHPNN